MEACSASPKSGISSLVDDHFDATEQTELPYQVRIENFEGPLDLLLHLIKKSEINIYDIPIHLIAQQYLTYIEAMEDLNLTVAGEFLVMAAYTLRVWGAYERAARSTNDRRRTPRPSDGRA